MQARNRDTEMLVYHASLCPDLIKKGIHPNNLTNCSRDETSQHIYVGTPLYLLTQFFNYAPKGTYHIYELNIVEEEWEELLTGGQWRSRKPAYPYAIVGTHKHG
jgi:hypothetical protein